MKLYVLTQSEIKKKAVYQSLLPNIFNEIEFVEKQRYELDNSVKIEQPFNNGGKLVCRKRINNFLNMNKINENDYILSIENFIINKDNQMFDIAICELYYNNTFENHYSEQARFPYILYEYLSSNSDKIYDENEIIGYTTTIGKIFDKYVYRIDKRTTHDNWIAYYNNFDRITQIQSALDKFYI